MSDISSLFYDLTVTDPAARARVTATFASEPAGTAIVASEAETFMAYGDAPQPLFSRLPIPYRVVPQGARTMLLRTLYSFAARRLGDTVAPRWPVERDLDDRRASAWSAAAATAGVATHAPSWPDGRRAALLITHDIDSAPDLERIAPLRAAEREARFVSSFGFVPQLSWPNQRVVEDLAAEGCESYLHDLAHDGRLPYRDADGIRTAIEGVFAASPWARALMRGFRAGQLLTSPTLRAVTGELFDYDLSIPDTERGGPYGYAGGCGTVFPFRVGRLVEIPLTLPQDVYLRHVYGLDAQQSLAVWQRKLEHIRAVGGVAVLNVHPVWVNPSRPDMWDAYRAFLRSVAAATDLWITTPGALTDHLNALTGTGGANGAADPADRADPAEAADSAARTPAKAAVAA